jgi:hypothetical protein
LAREDRDGRSIGAALVFGLYGDTYLFSIIRCCQGIESLGFTMRGGNGDVVTIPSDAGLITTTLQVELIV